VSGNLLSVELQTSPFMSADWRRLPCTSVLRRCVCVSGMAAEGTVASEMFLASRCFYVYVMMEIMDVDDMHD